MDLIERRQFDALVRTAWCWLKRIVEIAAARAITRMFGDDAVLRSPPAAAVQLVYRRVLSCMALLLASAGVIIVEVMVTHPDDHHSLRWPLIITAVYGLPLVGCAAAWLAWRVVRQVERHARRLAHGCLIIAMLCLAGVCAVIVVLVVQGSRQTHDRHGRDTYHARVEGNVL